MRLGGDNVMSKSVWSGLKKSSSNGDFHRSTIIKTPPPHKSSFEPEYTPRKRPFIPRNVGIHRFDPQWVTPKACSYISHKYRDVGLSVDSDSESDAGSDPFKHLAYHPSRLEKRARSCSDICESSDIDSDSNAHSSEKDEEGLFPYLDTLTPIDSMSTLDELPTFNYPLNVPESGDSLSPFLPLSGSLVRPIPKKNASFFIS